MKERLIALLVGALGYVNSSTEEEIRAQFAQASTDADAGREGAFYDGVDLPQEIAELYGTVEISWNA